MYIIRRILPILLILIPYLIWGQSTDIFHELEKRNFFRARELYQAQRASMNTTDQLLTEAILENAFNHPEVSNERIETLLSNKLISDSVVLNLYKLKLDNSVKLYDYKQAAQSIQHILNEYAILLNEQEKNDFLNSLKIWMALQDAPPQSISIPSEVRQKMKTDIVGLKNLTFFTEKDSIDFIFDTGANISTITRSTAKKIGLTVIPANIRVGTITGTYVSADLGVCPQLRLGDIDIYNAVFLVFEDSALYIPQINYQIHGIIGFPVIHALREIQISQDDYFIVPKNPSAAHVPSNMALDGLDPLIYIDGMHFMFDTGADETTFYHAFYEKYKTQIDHTYTQDTLTMSGAGGYKQFIGYTISHTFDFQGRKLTLDNVQVLIDKIKDEENVYGNIGQDLIRQFDVMTLNFEQMFIRFDSMK